MSDKKILITGSTGMLGRRVIKLLLSKTTHKIFGISRSGTSIGNAININLDLTDIKRLKEILEDIKPDIIIHTAALVRVDQCEMNLEYANLLHSVVTKSLATHSHDTRFIYFSTDSVYDGNRGFYTELDEPNPINNYAISKLNGERSALLCPNSLVLRGNIYGFHEPPGTHSLAEWALSEFQKGNQINGFTDSYFNPLYTGQLAWILLELSGLNLKGILNVGTDLGVSKYEFLCMLAQEFGFKKDMVRKSTIGENETVAKRPKNTILNTQRYCNLLNKPAPSLIGGLKLMKSEFDQTHLNGS